MASGKSEDSKYDLRGSKFGGGFAAEGGVQIGGQFIDASPKQNLTEAAQEIQELLEQLSSTYSSNTSTEQMIVATKAVEVIEGNPMLKKKIINAIKAGGSEMLRELVKHPAINVLLAAFEGWNSQVDT
jgi:hypothetical protein